MVEGDGRHGDVPTAGYKKELGMWQGVFSDAVTLVRSDRFYTVVCSTFVLISTVGLMNHAHRIGTLIR